jgi:hypothetical protein
MDYDASYGSNVPPLYTILGWIISGFVS